MKRNGLGFACAVVLPWIACGGSNSPSPSDAAQKGSDLAASHDLAASAGEGDLATTTDLATRIDLASASGSTDFATSPHDLATPPSFLVVESCAQSDYVDGRTVASNRMIPRWDMMLGKRCIHITPGQSVTWPGVPTTAHPLEPHDGNSTSGNPITNVSVNTFPNAGTFGYDCSIHHTLMHGAIWVDPS